VAVLSAAAEQIWKHLAIEPVSPRNTTISRDAVAAQKISNSPCGKGDLGLSEKCC